MDAPLHRHDCVVAFGDTDASGWMHFPNVFRYFEEAEHAFLVRVDHEGNPQPITSAERNALTKQQP